MRYNVSLILSGLLLLTLISMLTLTFYYKYTYDELRTEYRVAIDEVTDAAGDLNRTMQEVEAKEKLLNTKEQILIDYINELNLSKERETSLGTHFTELRGEKEELSTNLTEARERLDELSRDYERAKTDLDVCEVDYRICQEEAEDLPYLKGNFSKLEEDMNNAWDELSTALDKLESTESQADELKDEINQLENGSQKEEVLSELVNLETDLNSLRRTINDLEDSLDKALDRMQIDLEWMMS
ncbi:hypothetical protein ACFLRC_03530 [Candidatus Altiarchaeota archaeon]